MLGFTASTVHWFDMKDVLHLRHHAVQLYTEELVCNNFKSPGYVAFSLALSQDS